MAAPQPTPLLTTIRLDIERYGQSVVACDRLLELIPPTEPIAAQFGHIFRVAERERWSFEFRNDGTVRFAGLSPSPRVIPRWPEPGSASAGLARQV
ncbi:MAG TPA: hypothetical protein VM940_11180 [Chthoniobacterales bacterium]|jgi:hypothetical protein|nr:hypothetical protein [Chthoniobacterales bacterium]